VHEIHKRFPPARQSLVELPAPAQAVLQDMVNWNRRIMYPFGVERK
jgi:hypothetical protein